MLIGTKTLDGTHIDSLTPGSEKKVKLRCNSCRKKTVTQWNNYVQYQRKRGWSGDTYCQPCAARASGKKNKGKPNPAVVETNRKRRGSKHPSWNGGKYTDREGYIMVSVRQGRSNKSGWTNYRKEHVVIMEEHLDRPLKKEEVVHHIDGNKANNLLENLWLTDRKRHRKAHASLQKVSYSLLQKGIIGFDKNTGTYYIKER